MDMDIDICLFRIDAIRIGFIPVTANLKPDLLLIRY